MRYIQPTFTLPTSTGKLTQTDWEIAVGLRNPDGTLVQPNITEYRSWGMTEVVDLDGCGCGCDGCGFDCGCLCS